MGYARLAANVAAALVMFTAVIGMCQALALWNAGLTPGLPWFPLPALALVAGAVALARSRWNLRLVPPVGISPLRAYSFALLGTAAAMGIGVLEAAFHGLTRSAPMLADADHPGFNFAFLITLPLAASVMAEICFRGIIQTLLEKFWPIWLVLLSIAVLNGLMHFYDPDQMRQWLRFLALNGVWGYVTWRSQSLRPALAAHIAMNVVEPFAELLFGPTDMALLPPIALILTAIMTLLTGTAARALLRERILIRIPGPPG